jgi:hypothetical protein
MSELGKFKKKADGSSGVELCAGNKASTAVEPGASRQTGYSTSDAQVATGLGIQNNRRAHNTGDCPGFLIVS